MYTQSNSKIAIPVYAKAPAFVSIARRPISSNIDLRAIAQPRGFGAAEMPIFEPLWVYKTVRPAESSEIFSPFYLPLSEKLKIWNKKERVIVIAGPTGVGKSRLAVKLAECIGGEIVSADSMQVYRGMDIGTNKVTEDEKEGIKHYLLDVVGVREQFSVVDFYKEAHKAVKEVLLRNKVPIVVGGSGFYLHSFLYGPPLGPPSNQEVRDFLKEQLAKFGREALYERLQMLDPEYAKKVSEEDVNRITRALEIITISKKKVSDFSNAVREEKYDFRSWFLDIPREELYSKLDMRCEEMIKKGFIEEVKRLKEEGIEENPSASQAIGYRQCLKFLLGKESDESKKIFIEEFKKASRHFVKKQYTWFRKDNSFRWLNLKEIDEERVKEIILQDYEQGF